MPLNMVKTVNKYFFISDLFFASKKKGFIFAPLLFIKQRKIYVH